MTKRVSQFGKGIVEQELTNMFEPKWIRAAAKESGLIERERKIDPLIMFWTLAIGYGSQLYRTLTELKREYEVRGNVSISDSSWHDRFTPELVKFLKQCVTHGIDHISQEPSRILGERLAIFLDVMIQDSTIIRLHESLAEKWPATRSKKVAAGVKVSFLTSAVANGPKSISILPENTSEMKTLKIGPWIKNIILLVDLGFYKHQLFSRIVENGGSFVSRLKSNSNPLIVAVNQVRNCHGIDLKGKYLTEFYILLSLGGFIGGSFNSIIAPLIFNQIYEYYIIIFIASLLIPFSWKKRFSIGQPGHNPRKTDNKIKGI